MGNRPAPFKQADIRRAIRAAKAEGFDRVEIIDPKTGLRLVCEKTARDGKPESAERLE